MQHCTRYKSYVLKEFYGLACRLVANARSAQPAVFCGQRLHGVDTIGFPQKGWKVARCKGITQIDLSGIRQWCQRLYVYNRPLVDCPTFAPKHVAKVSLMVCKALHCMLWMRFMTSLWFQIFFVLIPTWGWFPVWQILEISDVETNTKTDISFFAPTVLSTTRPQMFHIEPPGTKTHQAVELEPKQGQNAKSSNLRYYGVIRCHDYHPWN